MGSRLELADLFEELTELIKFDEGGSSFRSRAYARATDTLRSSTASMSRLPCSKIARIEGLGKSTAADIREFYDTGSIRRLDDLRAKHPADFVRLASIPGLGGALLTRLKDELQICNINDLRLAISKHELRTLPGMGGDFEERLLKAIDRMGDKQNRKPFIEVLPHVEQMVSELRSLPEVTQADYAGSLRRFREEVSDIDLVVASDDPEAVMNFFVNTPRVVDIIVDGETHCSVSTDLRIQVDLLIVSPGLYGAALLHLTGGKIHNIRLRMRCNERGWKLSEQGLVVRDSGELLAGETEEEIYRALDLAFIEPPMRQGRGEIQAASKKRLPFVVRQPDLRGDLNLQTQRGRGKASEAQMIKACYERGYQYLAIMDRAEGEIDRNSHQELAASIADLRSEFPSMLLLHGCNLSIDEHGDLNCSDDLYEYFDLCIASVHGQYELGPDQQTSRLIRAMEEPCVRILGHMLSRKIGSRGNLLMDVDEVLKAAIDNDVAIEINASPSRLDASAQVIRRGVELGNVFVINSAADSVLALDNIRFGVPHSQRGWLPRERVINTWSREVLAEWLSSPYD